MNVELDHLDPRLRHDRCHRSRVDDRRETLETKVVTLAQVVQFTASGSLFAVNGDDALANDEEGARDGACGDDVRIGLIHFSSEQMTQVTLEIVATCAEEVAVFDVVDQATGHHFFVQQRVQLTQDLIFVKYTLLVMILVEVLDRAFQADWRSIET